MRSIVNRLIFIVYVKCFLEIVVLGEGFEFGVVRVFFNVSFDVIMFIY